MNTVSILANIMKRRGAATAIAALLLCQVVSPASAQSDPEYLMEIGGGVGLTGYLGDFIRSFPWIIAFALSASLAYAMLVVPSLEVRYIRAAGPAQGHFLSRAQAAFFSFIQRVYDRLEAFCFRHAFLTIAFGLTAIGLGVWMFLQLNVMMMPKADRDMFAVEIFLPDDAPLERTAAVSDSLSRLLLADARVRDVTAFIGTNAPRFHATYSPSMPGRNIAQLIVNIGVGVGLWATVPAVLIQIFKEKEYVYAGLGIVFSALVALAMCGVI